MLTISRVKMVRWTIRFDGLRDLEFLTHLQKDLMHTFAETHGCEGLVNDIAQDVLVKDDGDIPLHSWEPAKITNQIQVRLFWEGFNFD